MPLHRIYVNPGVFTPEEKKEISESITKVYHKLPPFYVIVVFIEVDNDSLYVGGAPANGRFVRIVSQHLARTNIGPKRQAEVVEALQACFAPYVKDRGLDWEIHIEEMDRETWRENGLRPPLPDTDAEKLWVKLNKPVPY